MSRIRFVCCLLVGVLLLSVAERGAARGTDCSSLYCNYIPVVTILQPVRIVDETGGRDRGGNYIIKGDVTAMTSNQVTDLVLEARVFDSEQLLGAFIGTTELKATLPGQLNPFVIGTNISTFEHPVANLHEDIRAIEWNSDGSPAFAPLTVVMTQTEGYMYLGTTVTATFRNDESLPMVNIIGMAWSFCQETISDGLLLADNLAPGETVTYTRFLWGVGGICVPGIRYTAQGQLSTETAAPASVGTNPFRLSWLVPFWGWDLIKPGRSWVMPFINTRP